MIYVGDCIDIMKTLPDCSVDAVVTDPPYGLSFMGKKWDYDVPSVDIWREVLRVLKPGGHVLSFGGTRTYHRMAVNIEDAGFEIRDQVMWLYGSGFPKSHNLKDEWQGWGTALKPANEPICLARKPLEKGLTVAENVLKWGTGAINVDGSRIETTGADKEKHLAEWDRVQSKQKGSVEFKGLKDIALNDYAKTGRWPANLLLDETAAEMLDEQSGVSKSVIRQSSAIAPTGNGKTHGKMSALATERGFADSGGASRFFYVAKASKSERNAGLEGMPEKQTTYMATANGMGAPSVLIDDKGRERDRFTTSHQNHHPTVKPIKLMEYLIKLITPPNGVILDPFMGSGSTGVAAKNLGFNFTGIELNEEYFEIAKKRIGVA